MSDPTQHQPNFDRIARAYRWLEYLTLGPLLARTRNHHLPRLHNRTQALILGDGDGRFTARLLAANPNLKADAVDLSQTMLGLLRRRVPHPRAAPVGSSRLRTHHADARTFTPTKSPDLIVTHFFLDCLTQLEVDALVARLTPASAPQTLWLISDFRIPSGPLHWPARAYIRLLYLAFRILTGLRTTHLPDHAAALRRCGFTRIAEHHELFGLLTTELWRGAPPEQILEQKTLHLH
jgi:SAM-dependent methyltransferase